MVTDPFFAENGVAEEMVSAAKVDRFAIFDEVTPDPDVELAARGVAAMKSFGPDLMIALGGGSAIDCAKAIKYFGKADCTLAVIPTTSGSGSEVTDFAVLTYGNVKHPIVDEKLRPDLAILDETLLYSMPASLVADSGFDVLSHALEAYVATDGGKITDILAREAFATAYKMLPLSFAGDKNARMEMHTASCMAGMAFTQAGLGVCHGLAHALGGVFHIPHGRLNAVLLPAVVGCNSQAASCKYAEAARYAGLYGGADAVAVRNLKNGLIRLRRELKLPDTLIQAGADLKALKEKKGQIIETALADGCCGTNPVLPQKELLCRILDEVTGRG